MLRKLNLDSTKDYEVAVAAQYCSKMLVAFLCGHEHILSIGAEQGEIAKWDDLVIKEAGNLKHIQIKRQTTDFSNDPSIRDNYSQGKRTGQPRDLSAFDKTIKSLADWIKINETNASNVRSFEVYITEGSIKIKSEFTILGFKTFCEEQIKEVTTATGLQQLQSNSNPVHNFYNWLTSWCSFQDWDHILKALRLLKIKIGGSRDDIDQNSISHLSTVFSSPDAVLAKIKGFIIDNSTFTGAIKPRHLFCLVKEYLRPEVNPWTQFSFDGMNWEISGTNDTDLADEIERPSVVVPALWGSASKGMLKLVIPNQHDSLFLNKALHLVLHLSGLSHSHVLNHAVWKGIISNKIGNTLGTDKNDCENLSLTENSFVYSSSENHLLDSSEKQDSLAVEIDTEIIRKTWTVVIARLTAKIIEMDSSELKTAMDGRWRSWYSRLNSDWTGIKKMFLSILHPVAEGKEINGELRIGLKTVNLIVDGLFLLLVVSVGLSDDHDSWNNIKNNFTARPIGLSYWSGASGGNKKVCEIDNHDSLVDLIGKETSEILVLSKVKSLESEIYNISLANTTIPENSLAHPHRPKLLVTNHYIVQKMIGEGKIDSIRNYLQEIIQRNEDSKINAINTAKS